MGRSTVPLGVAAALTILALAVRPNWRAWAQDWLHRDDQRVSRRTLAIFCFAAAAFLGRVVYARFAALEVNAWDFSLYFDRPVESTLHGRLLYSDFLKGSTLGDNASFAVLAFVPLYAITPSPLWLVLASGFAVAAAAGVGFLLFRSLFHDDVGALLLAAAFVLHSATARAAEYVFHVEIFYPFAIFFSLWALMRRRPVAFAAGMALLLALKEDAILPATALALCALRMRANRRWIAAAWVAAAAVFCADYFLVLPHFSAAGGGKPWFSWYWAQYGPTPLRAVLGMAGHPLQVAGDVVRSGVPKLLEPLLYAPVVGLEGLAASIPALIPYAVAQHRKLARFTLYYPMTVLPFLFVAAGWGLERIGRVLGRPPRKAFRTGSLVILAACALDGAGYVVLRPKPERVEIRPALAGLPVTTPVYLQGALLPHAGYAARFSVLDRSGASPDGTHAYLLDPAADPYPFGAREISTLETSLNEDPRYARVRTNHGLRLYWPRSAPSR